jgi:hypothetical protein
LVEPQVFIGFNISGHIFVAHTWNSVDGSWMKIHEKDFSKTIAFVKNYYIKTTHTLISKLWR